MLIASTGFVVNVSLYREPGYDAFKDFLPITELGSSPNVFLVHPSSSIRTMADLLAFAKADKNKLNVINPGQGSTPHLTVELLQLKTGIGMENIFYNGAGPSIQAILAQTTPVAITALPPAHPHIKSGALRALAVTSEKRWPDLPDVPTMQESGFPGMVSETFQGMYAPAGTPQGDRRPRGARHARGAEGPGGGRTPARGRFRRPRERPGRAVRAHRQGSADVARADREVEDRDAVVLCRGRAGPAGDTEIRDCGDARSGTRHRTSDARLGTRPHSRHER